MRSCSANPGRGRHGVQLARSRLALSLSATSCCRKCLPPREALSLQHTGLFVIDPFHPANRRRANLGIMVASLRTRQPSEDDQEEHRKARKRATDRRAQRDHRLRRKAYVKHLEESVKSLTEQQSPEERIAALLDEQKQLREKCNDMTAQLERVRAIVSKNKDAVDDSSEHLQRLPSPGGSRNDPGQLSTNLAAERSMGESTTFDEADPFFNYADSNHKDIVRFWISLHGSVMY